MRLITEKGLRSNVGHRAEIDKYSGILREDCDGFNISLFHREKYNIENGDYIVVTSKIRLGGLNKDFVSRRTGYLVDCRE
ncbi:MAG: hypothetical protein AABX73_02280 [Nanoarchaeota archaeon]|mgnify:CR=1 FL=1